MANEAKKDLRKKPLKRMGQNFLVNNNAVRKILEAAKISRNDYVLEIGAGTGILTKELLKAKRVFALEKDPDLCNILRKKFKENKNIEIVEGDALKIETDFLPKNYKIVANIPYYITSPLIRRFLELENKPSLIILTIQKEVAERICAKPPKMSLLAVSVQFYANAKIIAKIKKGCFWPIPKVDSAVIKIIPFNREKDDSFFKIVKAGFSHPRKQVINNLSGVLGLDKKILSDILLKSGIDPLKRPGDLSVEDWIVVKRLVIENGFMVWLNNKYVFIKSVFL